MTASTTSLQAICNAIETTLAPAVTYTQSYNELTEGMNDTPRLQVYPNSGTSVIGGQSNDRSTFRAGVRQASIEVYADLYATQRSEIGEDMGILVPLIEAVIAEIEKQDTRPYFGLLDASGRPAIDGFNWRWDRAIFVYNDTQQTFAGARFTFNIRVF